MPLPIIYSKKYDIDISEHPWQVNKYKETLKVLLEKGITVRERILYADEAEDEDLLLAHDEDYITRLKEGNLTREEIMRSELPVSPSLVRFFWASVQGTIIACREALEKGAACHVGGGFHHAFPDYGSGFCLINDIAVGMRKMKQEDRINKAMVVDLDVHQGDGTAYIFQDDDSVFTFSMHQENNFPYPKQKSDLDIGLDDDTADKEYLTHLETVLPKIVKLHKPELIVYVAGADPYEGDALGGLALTLGGLKRRDEIVFEEAVKNHIPFVTVFAGGYARDPHDTVKIHSNTIIAANEIHKNIRVTK